MDHGELALMLMETPGIGPAVVGAILRRTAILRRPPEAVLTLAASAVADEYGVRMAAAQAIAAIAPPACQHAAEQARALRRRGVAILTLLDAAYPARLIDRLPDPPPVLFAYGSLPLLEQPLFAVACSNGAPESALLAGDRAAEKAHEAGAALVTGHNRIPYQRPALAVRRAGGRICYVLDRGLIAGFGGDLGRALFPAARIWGPAYDPAVDLTLSPFAPNDHGIAQNNRLRDGLVFALADTIYEAYLRPGGTMQRECRIATARGQAVMPASSNSRDTTDGGGG